LIFPWDSIEILFSKYSTTEKVIYENLTFGYLTAHLALASART